MVIARHQALQRIKNVTNLYQGVFSFVVFLIRCNAHLCGLLILFIRIFSLTRDRTIRRYRNYRFVVAASMAKYHSRDYYKPIATRVRDIPCIVSSFSSIFFLYFHFSCYSSLGNCCQSPLRKTLVTPIFLNSLRSALVSTP